MSTTPASTGDGGPTGSWSSTEKLIESLRHERSALMEERLVAIDAKERGLGRNALRFECGEP